MRVYVFQSQSQFYYNTINYLIIKKKLFTFIKMVVQNINSASEFFSLLKDKHYKYTVVDYTAKWCNKNTL